MTRSAGELLSAARQAMGAAPLAPATDDTLRELTGPQRRAPQAYQPLPAARAREGFAGYTAEMPRLVLDDEEAASLIVDVATLLARAKVPTSVAACRRLVAVGLLARSPAASPTPKAGSRVTRSCQRCSLWRLLPPVVICTTTFAQMRMQWRCWMMQTSAPCQAACMTLTAALKCLPSSGLGSAPTWHRGSGNTTQHAGVCRGPIPNPPRPRRTCEHMQLVMTRLLWLAWMPRSMPMRRLDC